MLRSVANVHSISRSITSCPSPRSVSAMALTAPRCSASGLTLLRGGAFTDTAIRSRPGGAAAASANDGPPSLIASRKRALSATRRAIGPQVARPCHGASLGTGTRPRCTFRPNSPQKPDGIRIEPAPSEPRAIAARPAATAVRRPAARSRRTCGRDPRGCG